MEFEVIKAACRVPRMRASANFMNSRPALAFGQAESRVTRTWAGAQNRCSDRPSGKDRRVMVTCCQ